MKALAIARKTLRELLREPQLLAMLLGFPAMLVAIYYLAFGTVSDGMASAVRVLVLDEDIAAAGAVPGPGPAIVDAARAFELEGKPALRVESVQSREVAETAVREHKASLLLTLPVGFGRALDAAARGEGAPAKAVFVGDPSAYDYQLAAGFLDDAIHTAGRKAARRAETVTVDYEFLPGTGKLSDFEVGVPGLIVFGLLFAVISSATTLVRETVARTLRRLRLTRAGAFELLAGVTLAHLALALVQVPFTFGVAAAFGFRSPGSLPLAMAVGVLVAVAAVGLGLIVACFARTDGEAANLGAGVLVPMAFLSGAMFPLPPAPIATVAGRTLSAYDLLPPSHATEALRRILVHGAGLRDVAFEVSALATLSALLFAAGVLLYRRMRLQEA